MTAPDADGGNVDGGAKHHVDVSVCVGLVGFWPCPFAPLSMGACADVGTHDENVDPSLNLIGKKHAVDSATYPPDVAYDPPVPPVPPVPEEVGAEIDGAGVAPDVVVGERPRSYSYSPPVPFPDVPGAAVGQAQKPQSLDFCASDGL